MMGNEITVDYAMLRKQIDEFAIATGHINSELLDGLFTLLTEIEIQKPFKEAKDG